ncbi:MULTISPECIES: MarR family transcriptional regulator [Actinoalloteichus]|uniref:Uncharacterized protein n=1 Tax=Actinoalloteichus fjordicus TaxID=1612552 RepID=A0AAC9PSR4_9PSEU|nr:MULTISPECIES: helix-turn-helix domain-containing protein [Actinoalloteichus]APU15290.1 hypothetical protein UA74_16210 [Actinoalloteichus fjordicus]APU21335.1 hypothetical protein UA75_16635 [Actinoalloteichus sp. GBA129-24]
MPDTTNTTRLHAVPGGRRTDAEHRLWRALHDNPGSTAADLAFTAGIGRSTATKILATWDTEGSATRTAGIATGGRRPADRWSVIDVDGPADTDTDVEPDTNTDSGSDSDSDGDGATPSGEEVMSVRLAVVPDAPTDTAADPTPAEADVPIEEAPPAPSSTDTAPTPRTGPTGRLAKGALRGMVEDYLTAHPGESFGPAQLGKRLGRSGGAVANALERLVADGYARRVAESPKRYQAVEGDAPTA